MGVAVVPASPLDKAVSGRRAAAWLWLAVAGTAALRVWLGATRVTPFNSDEAVVALMARHILQGEPPVFFYGQAYMGSLDAFLVAAGFLIFGQQVWVIRLVQALLYIGILITTACLGRLIFRSTWVGLLAAWLLAIPTVNVALYTTASLGGYGEALLIGNLILILAVLVIRRLQVGEIGPRWQWLALGVCMGLGLWAFGLTLIYTVPAALALAWHILKGTASRSVQAGRLAGSAVLLGLGALGGSLPWWLYALQNGFDRLLGELGGEAIAAAESLPWLGRVAQHLISLVLLGIPVIFGFRPPWEVSWLALPLAPIAVVFWVLVLAWMLRYLRKGWRENPDPLLLFGLMGVLLAGFLFTPFGADPTGRYFVPLAVPLALFGADLVQAQRRRWGNWALGAVVGVLAFNFLGIWQSANRIPPGMTTQFYAATRVDHRYDDELIEFLRRQGETRGYSNYWVTYPLAFLSREELIFTPRLPYHLDFRYTPRDDRYEPYQSLVAQADRVAYITFLHPDLDEHLRSQFSRLGVSFQESQIGDYRVFHALSQPVHPQQIGLGVPR